MTSRPFADHVADYALAGWCCILPVPAAEKHPPPVGFTGAEGRDTTPEDLVRWVGSHPGHSIALRMPDGVIGIDVDSYAKGEVQKRGAETLAHFEGEWGRLPATWTSTARGEGPSRIHFFRVPAQRYATRLAVGGPGGSGDVEIIQRHHRYAVVWPSPHAAAGGTYTWYDPTGQPAPAPPKPEELAELPAAWVAGLAEGAAAATAASSDRASGEALLGQLLDDWRPECADVTNARLHAVELMSGAEHGSRYDTMVGRTHHLVQLAAGGHTGVAHAFLELRDLWARLTAGEEREGEFDRALLTSARKAVTVVGPVQVPRDPCLLVAGFEVPGPAPADSRSDAEDPEPIAPTRMWSPYEVIGTHTFDPAADLDQTLAEAVLERVWPAIRYAYDAGKWLRRGPEQWEVLDDVSRWAVSQVTRLMPPGDPTADKGSEQHARSSRRARLASSKGAAGVASKMRDLTVAGYHPASVRMADLDTEPEVLWAGGMAYSLRDSLEGPAFAAQVDPATPHVRSAAVTPENGPTPLWDAFLAAVWPDPAVRAWSLRVLSVALTGHSPRILPLLVGEGGRGKTQTVELLMSVLGSYARRADTKLLSSPDKAHGTFLYDLKGHRLAFIDEGPPEGKWAQERLKDITGGGMQTANQMHKDSVNFMPTHTLILTANDHPSLIDAAVRARVRLIPCEGDPDSVAAARAAIGSPSSRAWRAEAPGVLASMMREAAGWLAEPETASQLAAPKEIRYLAEEISAEQDPVRVWLEEETEPFEPGTSSRELYQAFRLSCQRSGIRGDQIPNEHRWGRTLTRLGYPSEHTRYGKRRLLRIRVNGSYPPPVLPVPGTESVTLSDPSVTLPTPNGHNPKPQVNPDVSVDRDPCDPSTEGNSTHAYAPAREPAKPDPCPEASHSLSHGEAKPPADLRKHRRDPSGHRQPSPKPATEKRQQTEAARQKAAEKREAKRRAAIAEAAGEHVGLPALVTRAGAVRRVEPSEADQLLDTITGQPVGELTVDVETTGYPIGHRHYALRTVQLGGEHFALVLDPVEHADVVRRHLAAADVLHAHSATADLVPLAHAGLADEDALWAKMVDTAILAKLADPSSTDNSADLKNLSRAVLGKAALSPAADKARAALFKAGKWLTDTEVTTELERSGWAQVDPGCETQVRYAAADVLDDAALARRLEVPPARVLERERVVQRMTARMASTGFRFAPDRIERLHAEHTEARTAHAEQVRGFGVENPGSTQQVGQAFGRIGVLLPPTDTGKPSVAGAVLEPMRNHEGPGGDLARAVLDWRHHDTALKLLLEPWRELVHRGDGRARSTIYTLGADTGRMSSVRFNFQQVSREGGLRGCITADPGSLLASADFAGVELRVAGALSGDQQLIAIMNDPDRDLHWEVARLAFGPQATKAQRYAIKRGVFGRIYGGGVGAVAAGVGVSRPVAQQVIDAMDALTPQLTEWSRMVREGIEAGRSQFQAYSGRVIHLPKLAPHAGPNYCIQGTARELLVDALLRWRQTRWGDCVLLPVHDEIVAMVPQDEAEAATAALVECMTTDLHGVPIIAEPSEPSFEWKDSA